MYLCNRENIYQIDLLESSLENGLIKVGEFEQSKTGGLFDYMSLGPDCRIYVRQIGAFQFDFSSINYPNEKGLDCDFRQGNVIMPEPPNLGNFPHFPRFRVDEDMPCCPTTITPVEDAPDLEEVICGDWYETVKIFGEQWCLNSSAYSEMRLYKKDNLDLFYFERFVNDVGRGAFFDLNGYTVGRSETRDGVFTVYPDSIQDYELVRVLGDCHTGFPSCENIVYDCPGLMADIGDTCNDGDFTTTDDAITQSCTCEGQIIYDCPDLMLDIGDICDDGNPDTIDDVISNNCTCEGQIAFDCLDLMADIGDVCDDNNPNTNNDIVNDNCLCEGEYIFPPSSCPDSINEIFCEQWLLDSLSALQHLCDMNLGVIFVEHLQKDTLHYVHINLCAFAETCEGQVYTCTGEPIGSSITNAIGTNFNPNELNEFSRNPIDDCRNGYIECPTIDNDGDGFTASEDCNDNNPNVFPGATEVCNDIDDDCDGQIDEGFTVVRYYLDGDDDGYGVPSPSLLACAQPAGYALTFDDCDDNDPTVNPGQVEGPYNGLDDDCDPATPDDDLDGDGYVLVDDCNDNDPAIHPDAVELCDDIDNNCNDEIDEGIQLITGYADMDGDGFGSSTDSIVDCVLLTGYVTNNNDCMDTDPNINPDVVEEPYNGLDDDCDPATPDDDLDGDGFLLVDDCNDLDSLINTSAEEIPNNGIDEDCDGEDETTSTIESEKSKITVYPNPTKDILHISSDSNSRMIIRVLNPQGVVLSQQNHTKSIDLSHLSDGVYILKIDINDTSEYVQKVIKI